MSLTSFLLKEKKLQNSFYIIQTETNYYEQQQRRKSCICSNCGKLNQIQFKFMNVPRYIQQFSDIRTISNNNLNFYSKRNISFDNIKNEVIIKDQISTIQYSQTKKKRWNSCECQQCGKDSKFQEFCKLIKIERKRIKSKKRIRKQNLEQMLRGISPIRQIQYNDNNEDTESWQNNKSICNMVNFVVDKKIKRCLVRPKKQIVRIKQNIDILKLEQVKQNLKTSQKNCEFGWKSDKNKKINLPMVKSSQMKTIEIRNIYEVQKQNPKFSNRQ